MVDWLALMLSLLLWPFGVQLVRCCALLCVYSFGHFRCCAAIPVYETSIVFESLDTFKMYMDSEGTIEEDLVAALQPIAVGKDIYMGARVHDEFPL